MAQRCAGAERFPPIQSLTNRNTLPAPAHQTSFALLVTPYGIDSQALRDWNLIASSRSGSAVSSPFRTSRSVSMNCPIPCGVFR